MRPSPLTHLSLSTVTRAVRRGLACATLALSLLRAVSAAAAKAHSAPLSAPVHINARNVDFLAQAKVELHVTSFDGELVQRSPTTAISLDDLNSFVVHIDSAHVTLSSDGLTELLNTYVLPKAKSPVRDLHVSFSGQTVRITGHIHKLVDLPFTAMATVAVTPLGSLLLHVTEMRALGFLHKDLLSLLGIDLSAVAKPTKGDSFHISGDDIIFPIQSLFPPPRVIAKLTSVHLEGDKLVQQYGPATPPTNEALPAPALNYVHFRGGTLHFARFTMDDVDMELIDEKPATPFRFSLQHYYRQLVDGYSRTLPNGALLIYMPDYGVTPGKK